MCIRDRVRSVLLSLKERLGRDIGAEERIVAYIPASAAYLYNRLHRGEDGKVPYERVKGKKPSVVVIEFAEKVFGYEAKWSRVWKDQVQTGV
eukprot:10480167-Karenia_brevis.AAC.1